MNVAYANLWKIEFLYQFFEKKQLCRDFKFDDHHQDFFIVLNKHIQVVWLIEESYAKIKRLWANSKILDIIKMTLINFICCVYSRFIDLFHFS